MYLDDLAKLSEVLHFIGAGKSKLTKWEPVAGDLSRAQATFKDKPHLVLCVSVEKPASASYGWISLRVLNRENALANQQPCRVTESRKGQISVTAIKCAIIEKVRANS